MGSASQCLLLVTMASWLGRSTRMSWECDPKMDTQMGPGITGPGIYEPDVYGCLWMYKPTDIRREIIQINPQQSSEINKKSTNHVQEHLHGFGGNEKYNAIRIRRTPQKSIRHPQHSTTLKCVRAVGVRLGDGGKRNRHIMDMSGRGTFRNVPRQFCVFRPRQSGAFRWPSGVPDHTIVLIARKRASA